jgi:hypothetical protein
VPVAARLPIRPPDVAVPQTGRVDTAVAAAFVVPSIAASPVVDARVPITMTLFTVGDANTEVRAAAQGNVATLAVFDDVWMANGLNAATPAADEAPATTVRVTPAVLQTAPNLPELQPCDLAAGGVPFGPAVLEQALQPFAVDVTGLENALRGLLARYGPWPWLCLALAVAAASSEMGRRLQQTRARVNDDGALELALLRGLDGPEE